MSPVKLSQFAEYSCELPAEVTPPTYRVGSRRHLYFIDHRPLDESVNLRELVLLPCGPDELPLFYALTLGIENAPGATAVGTSLMEEFGLSLIAEHAYDRVSGDIGSKKCSVVFPSNTTPEQFEKAVSDAKSRDPQGYRLIRQATDDQPSKVSAAYSSPLQAFFGRFVFARSFSLTGCSPSTLARSISSLRRAR